MIQSPLNSEGFVLDPMYNECHKIIYAEDASSGHVIYNKSLTYLDYVNAGFINDISGICSTKFYTSSIMQMHPEFVNALGNNIGYIKYKNAKFDNTTWNNIKDVFNKKQPHGLSNLFVGCNISGDIVLSLSPETSKSEWLDHSNAFVNTDLKSITINRSMPTGNVDMNIDVTNCSNMFMENINLEKVACYTELFKPVSLDNMFMSCISLQSIELVVSDDILNTGTSINSFLANTTLLKTLNFRGNAVIRPNSMLSAFENTGLDACQTLTLDMSLLTLEKCHKAFYNSKFINIQFKEETINGGIWNFTTNILYGTDYMGDCSDWTATTILSLAKALKTLSTNSRLAILYVPKQWLTTLGSTASGTISNIVRNKNWTLLLI